MLLFNLHCRFNLHPPILCPFLSFICFLWCSVCSSLGPFYLIGIFVSLLLQIDSSLCIPDTIFFLIWDLQILSSNLLLPVTFKRSLSTTRPEIFFSYFFLQCFIVLNATFISHCDLCFQDKSFRSTIIISLCMYNCSRINCWKDILYYLIAFTFWSKIS